MSTQTEFKAVAARYLEISRDKSKIGEENGEIVPITKIHNIPVWVKFEPCPRGELLLFRIIAQCIEERYDIKQLYVKSIDIKKNTKVDEVEEFMKECFEFIRNCVFDRMFGKFVLAKTPTLFCFTAEMAEGLAHIETSVKGCCVCLELTNTKTRCGHTLCVECWSQIKSVRNTETECYEDPCPMCRFDLSSELDEDEDN